MSFACKGQRSIGHGPPQISNKKVCQPNQVWDDKFGFKNNLEKTENKKFAKITKSLPKLLIHWMIYSPLILLPSIETNFHCVENHLRKRKMLNIHDKKTNNESWSPFTGP